MKVHIHLDFTGSQPHLGSKQGKGRRLPPLSVTHKHGFRICREIVQMFKRLDYSCCGGSVSSETYGPSSKVDNACGRKIVHIHDLTVRCAN